MSSFCFLMHALDLLLIAPLKELHAFIDKVTPVAQQALDQSGQSVGAMALMAPSRLRSRIANRVQGTVQGKMRRAVLASCGLPR